MDKAASLVADLLAFIAMDDCTDDQFNQLALRLSGTSRQLLTLRSVAPRRWQKLRNGALHSY